MKLGALVWNQYTDWESLRDTGTVVDRLGYDSLWTWDHLYPIVGSPDGPMFEGWLSLAAWAEATQHAHIGLMVGANTFRNPALVAFLRGLIQSRRVTIALHGYTHQDYADGYEFQAGPDLPDRVQQGRAYLETLLGCRISLFVPPHNALSKRGMAAVAAAGLDILGSFLSFRPSMRPWDWRTVTNWWAVQRYRRATGRSRRDPFVYPHALRYARHAEFGCHSLIPGTTVEMLRRQAGAGVPLSVKPIHLGGFVRR